MAKRKSRNFVDYNKLRKSLEVRVEDIASAIGVTYHSLEKNPGSEKIQTGLRKIAYTYRVLSGMVGSEEGALIWLRAPNPEYDGLSPLEIITQGKIDAIIGYLEDVKKGSLY